MATAGLRYVEDEAAAHCRVGTALLREGRLGEAAMSFKAALGRRPEYPEAIGNLGVVLQRMGRPEQAAVCYRKAIALWPGYAEAHANLGAVLEGLGFPGEAIGCYEAAIALRPGFAAAWSNRGSALRAVGRFDEAIASCERAIALEPKLAEAHLNLGNACKEQGRLARAVECYRRAIALDPENAGIHGNLGDTFRDMDCIAEARASFERAMRGARNLPGAYSNMLYFHAFTRDVSLKEERALARGWEKCALSDDERAAARARASVRGGVFAARPLAGRKLRLGIVSAELGTHAVAEFLQPVLEALDRGRIELVLFPTVHQDGARAQRIRGLADASVPLVGVPDALAAERIRAEGIDVLMDTTGHTSNCRLGIFAHRAAPVQVTYIGYWGTTGLTEMDWMLADRDALGAWDDCFTEGLWRLPRFAQCYRGDRTLAESAWTPGETVWLGSFNKYAKMRAETLQLWAKVLLTLPEAKLLLEDRTEHEEETHARIRAGLEAHGVSGERVEFVPMIDGHARHMALYDRLDIALDTVPFNSGTTCFDALWMGVPLVTLEGGWTGGRIASSALRALGREEWIALTEERFVAIVCALARDVAGRVEMRRAQREKMAASVLCDAAGLAVALEDAFAAMYARWLSAE